MSLGQEIEVELQEWMGNDRSIANSAWTSSYDKEIRELKSDDDVRKVIKAMTLGGHGVPFEAVIFRFWMRIPIFTDRQHMTHRIASHNGLSGRYRTVPDEYFEIPDDVQDIFDKAQKDSDGRWTKVMGHPNLPVTFRDLGYTYVNTCETAVNNYGNGMRFLKQAEKDGIITNSEFKRAREIWRGQMPQSAMTERTTIFNLRSFSNYQRQRNSHHAQPEIREVAKKMLQLVEDKKICPIALEELQKVGWTI